MVTDPEQVPIQQEMPTIYQLFLCKYFYIYSGLFTAMQHRQQIV